MLADLFTSRTAADPGARSTTWTRSRSTSWTSQAGPERSTTWTSTSWTRRATVTVAAALGSVVGFGPGMAMASTLDESGPTVQYVVRAQPGQLSSLHTDLAREATVVRQIDLISADVVRMTAAQAAHLSADPRVLSVTRDARVQLASSRRGWKQQGNTAADRNQQAAGTDSTVRGTGKASATLSDVASQIGIAAAHDAGITGDGVDVALIDSGVSPVEGLAAGKVVYGPDLSFDSQDDKTRYLDGYGHGTHLAGIIAGETAGFEGVARDSRIVSVKVADAHGNADVSQVIAALDWVVSHAHSGGLNVRVLNLSFGTDSAQAYQIDPLAYAAEQAWHAGIVVVTSVGNTGKRLGRLTDPASDPYVLAVGSADTTYVVPRVSTFSARGNGVRNPDLVAPGAHIESLQPKGTEADKEAGTTARKANGLFLGSGTSQAAAVVSGAVALLLGERPDLTPDQVKAMLRATANPLASGSERSQGKGLVDVGAALALETPDAQQTFARSTGTGSLEAARGSLHVRDGKTVLTGEQDIFGQTWQGPGSDLSAWGGSTLTSTNWGAVAWGSTNWGSTNWASSNWASSNWASSNWAATNWG